MNWLHDLLTHPDAAQSIFVLCLTGAAGMALARIKIAGIAIGIAGVLFAGLAIGNFGIQLHPEVSTFAKELGLLLFVYTIGIELGPSFFTSLRRQGLTLNFLALLVVLGGIGLTLLFSHLLNLAIPLAVGLLTGATTNTPSLGAAQQALAQLPAITEETLRLPGIGYALAYPFGVIGIISTLVFLRLILRISIDDEARRLKAAETPEAPPIARWTLKVTNPNLHGLPLHQIPGLNPDQIVVSRILHQDRLAVALPTTTLHLGDLLTAVGPASALESLRLVLGEKTNTDLLAMPGPVEARRIVVTHPAVAGASLQSLNLTQHYGVNITRLHRSGIELQPRPGLPLQMGDILTAVGQAEDLDRVAARIGNSPKALEHLNILPFFIGIALGVLLGALPIALPGLPAPVKLGLAGGPLLVGMILSRFIRVGPFVWYMPPNANTLLREAGIILFLACVGLKAGPGFTEALFQGPGLLWMAVGAAITILPLLLAAAIGRFVFKLNYLTLCGALSGSLTDPPALAYANSLASSNGPAIAYATVYPLTMILRIVSAQLLILFAVT